MLRAQTLIERLAKGKALTTRTVLEDRAGLLRSVLRNVQCLLNTRRGSAAAQLDLGIPPPNEIVHDFPDSINTMQGIIRDCIEKYEPRLTNVDVVYIQTEDDLLSLHFQISAKLVGVQNQPAVSLNTTVDPTGQIQMQG